eukprot:3470892-Amphidinium_carterae.1
MGALLWISLRTRPEIAWAVTRVTRAAQSGSKSANPTHHSSCSRCPTCSGGWKIPRGCCNFLWEGTRKPAT